MKVVGHGIDIIDIEVVSKLVIEQEDHFLKSFTQAELADVGEGVRRLERLAGRFAAKESVMKALGVGWGEGISWSDIEILTNEFGAPYVTLHGRVLDIANGMGVSSWLISTSHSRLSAIASAIAFK